MRMNAKVKQLVFGTEGVHLSLYIQFDAKKDRTEVAMAAIELAQRKTSFSSDTERRKFFDPIWEAVKNQLAEDAISPGIVILRSHKILEVSRLDFECATLCVVSKSFHIKPILKALQTDFAFGLIHFNKEGAQIWKVERNDLKLIARERLHKTETSSDYEVNAANRIFAERVDKALAKSAELEGLEIRLSGSSKPLWAFLKYATNRNINSEWLCEGSAFRTLKQSVEMTRAMSEFKRLQEHEKEVHDGLCAYEDGRTRNNIFQIAQDAALGNVKKLFVSLEDKIWGNLDESTGFLNLSENADATRGDDILDDLSELVFKKGGEVVVLDKSQMPKHLLAFSLPRERGARRIGLAAS